MFSRTRFSISRVQAPFGHERLLNRFRVAEFEVTDFSGDDGTFMSRFQTWDQFGFKLASFLWVQVTNFLRDINKRGDSFVMALFCTFFCYATSSANLNR